MFYLVPVPKQFVDFSGVPYSGGFVTVYVHGTTDKAQIYAEADSGVLLHNPCHLDSNGAWKCFVPADTPLDYIVQDRDGNVVASYANIVMPMIDAAVTKGYVDLQDQLRDKNFAADYDATQAYSVVGTYVIHEGRLYKSAVVIDEPEEWNVDHWTECNVTDELNAKIAAEAQSRTLADSAISATISAETSRAQAAEAAAKTEVVQGENCTIEKTTAADGHDVYTVNADGKPQVQADWNQADSSEVDYIKNKPNLGLKADKVQGATAGNLAALDASGNLTDSGSKVADFKTKQTPVTDPSASGVGLEFIDSVTQDANGEITPHKKAVQDGTTAQKGVVKLSNAIDSTSVTEAATPKAVKDAYDELNNKIVARAVFLSQAEWAVQSQLEGDPAKVYYVENGTGEDAYTVYVWRESTSTYEEVDESSIDLDGYWHDSPTTTGSGNVVTDITLGNDGVPQVEKGLTALTQHQSVTDNNPTLDWSTTSKVGMVGSTDLHVTMPTNPAQNLPASVITSGTFGTDRIADDAITAAKVKDNETLPVNVSGIADSAQTLPRGYASFRPSVTGYKKIAELNPPSASNDIIAVFEIYETLAWGSGNSFKGLLTVRIRNNGGSYTYAANFIHVSAFRYVALSVRYDPSAHKLLLFAFESNDVYCGLYAILAGSGGWPGDNSNGNVTLFADTSTESVSGYTEVAITTSGLVNASPNGVGSPTTPVYIDPDGQVQPCDPSQMSVGNATAASAAASGSALETAINAKLGKTGDASNATSTFTKASGDTSTMTSGGKLSVLFTAISSFFASVASALGGKADKANITGATKCKITYNGQGIVTSGADLDASDIPNLPASKITSGTFDEAMIPSSLPNTGVEYLLPLVHFGASNITPSTRYALIARKRYSGNDTRPGEMFRLFYNDVFIDFKTYGLIRPYSQTATLTVAPLQSFGIGEAGWADRLHVTWTNDPAAQTIDVNIYFKFDVGEIKFVTLYQYNGQAGGDRYNYTWTPYQGIESQYAATAAGTEATYEWDRTYVYGSAKYASKIGSYDSHPQIGGPATPVYVDPNGQVQPCDPSQIGVGAAEYAVRAPKHSNTAELYQYGTWNGYPVYHIRKIVNGAVNHVALDNILSAQCSFTIEAPTLATGEEYDYVVVFDSYNNNVEAGVTPNVEGVQPRYSYDLQGDNWYVNNIIKYKPVGFDQQIIVLGKEWWVDRMYSPSIGM